MFIVILVIVMVIGGAVAKALKFSLYTLYSQLLLIIST